MYALQAMYCFSDQAITEPSQEAMPPDDEGVAERASFPHPIPFPISISRQPFCDPIIFSSAHSSTSVILLFFPVLTPALL
jgi:hypothetical protein